MLNMTHENKFRGKGENNRFDDDWLSIDTSTKTK